MLKWSCLSFTLQMEVIMSDALNSSHPKGFQSDVFSSLCMLGNLRISEATQFVVIILLSANVS